MRFHKAEPGDADVLRSIARASLAECCSEFLTSEQIDQVVDDRYSTETVGTLREDDSSDLLLVERDGTIVGFAELSVPTDSSVGTIERLHVDPNHRDPDVLAELVSEAESILFDRDVVRVEVVLLGTSPDLLEAVRNAGFDESEETVTMIAETPIERHVLFKIAPEDPSTLLVPIQVEDDTLYIAFDQGRSGGKGGFFAVYKDENRDRRYGFYCDNCGSVETTMDPMGRVACASCGNTAKPTEWDATSW